jgi:anti-anti-sigma regulatory factor
MTVILREKQLLDIFDVDFVDTCGTKVMTAATTRTTGVNILKIRKNIDALGGVK